MKLLILIIICGWPMATVLAALNLADALQRRNRRRHNLGKWLRFHGGIK